MFRKHEGDDVKVVVRHECSMPPSEDIIVRYIDSGFCVATRRRIRRMLTVSCENPRSRQFLRSTTAIRMEESRHLQYYYYMIHPFSDGRAYWEFFMMFVFFGLLMIIPIENATIVNVVYIRLPKFILNMICLVDIGVTFASGYYESHTKKIVLSRRKVARRYITGYFMIDLLSSLPADMIINALGMKQSMWFVKLLTYLKLLRLTTFMKYLDRFRDRKEYSIYKFKAFKLFITFLIALLWATSIVYLLELASSSWDSEGNTTYIGLLRSCYRALYNILLIGYGYKPIDKIGDMIFSMICVTLGVVLQMFIYAQTLALLNKNLSASNKYQHMLRQLFEYIRYKQLPDKMRKRILLYFDFRFEKNYYKEAEILGTLSENLRQDIILHTCQNLVEKVEFFRNLPPTLLSRIVKCMNSEIYLTNDVIVKAGIAGDSMYFIASGTIAVYTRHGKEMCHLADGSHFGEVSLLLENEKRIASVVAVECCELFNLNRKDFQKAIGPYPELSHRMRQIAQKRLQKTMRVMSEDALEPSERPSLQLESFIL